MGRVASSIRIYLFRDQYEVSEAVLNGIRDYCCFIVKVYVMFWFTCENTLTAPRSDLKFLKELNLYERINKNISEASLKTFMRHLWYLNEINVGYAFFDDTINKTHLKKMVLNLKKKSKTNVWESKVQIEKKNIKKLQIWDFVNEKTMHFFEILNVSTEFLLLDPSEWKALESYQIDLKRLQNVPVVNDLAERSVALISEFNNSITNDEEQKQFLMQVVEKHRSTVKTTSKLTVVKGISMLNDEEVLN